MMRYRRRGRWFIARVLCACVCVPAVVRAQADDDGQPLVTSVRLHGVNSVDRGVLLNGLATKATSCKNILFTPICLISRSPTFANRRHLDPVELRRDVIRIRLFYWRRGYRDVEVASRTERDGGGVKVMFDIRENTPTIVERLTFERPDSVLPASVIASAMQLRENQPLDLIAIDSGIVLLRTALWERGYADATVQLDTSEVDNTRNAGPVTVRLEAGPRTTVRDIEISGNQAVSVRTVRRLLRLSPGGLYVRSAMLQSQRELYLSGLFSQVDMAAEETVDSAKVVSVRLTEAPLHRVDAATGFTTADFLQADASFTRFNFLGGASRLTIRGTVSNLLAAQLNGTGVLYDVTGKARGAERDRFLRPTWAASIDFAQPWFLATGNEISASLFTHRRSVPGVVTDVGAGGTVSLTRDLGAFATLTAGYTYEQSRIDASDVYFCVSVGLCLPSTIEVASRRHPLAPVAMITMIDQTNDPFAPTRGVLARLDAEHASRATGSDYGYNRATVTASTYRRVTARGVVST